VNRIRSVVLFAACLATLPAAAEIRLPNALSDHAVLQRQQPIHLWGWSTPGAHLTAHFHQQTSTAQANNKGEWVLYLNPESAGGPYALTLSGDGPEKKISDLLVGDVWLASGQSNMEMPLAGFPPTAFVNNAAQEMAAATNPRLRLLLVPHKSSDTPVSDIPSTWTECTPETAKNFSAVAYFFGRALAAKENVPIGLIDSTWGGTPADSWTSMNTLGSDPRLLPAFAERASFSDEQADAAQTIDAEKQQDAAAKAAGQPAPPHGWHPDEVSWSPAGLYNGMIAPLTPMAIKGFLWYQGETNSGSGRATAYAPLFTAMIGDWRMHFAQGNLPFLYVQISSFSSPKEDWGLVRDGERRGLSVANTAMAVSLDRGNPDNVHPADKQTIGARLALAARGLVYGEPVPYSGPLFREATTEPRPDGTLAMRVWFDHAEGLSLRNQGESGFEVAGPDRNFVPARAAVEGSTIVVSAPAINRPTYVRYGWTGVVPGFIYNHANLPAPTFTSEPDPQR
jgi:sialate O-acetylesterase